MQLNDNEFNFWLRSVSMNDLDRFFEFDKTNGLQTSAIFAFHTIKLADLYPLGESENLGRPWEEAIRACAIVPCAASLAFAFDHGMSRWLNLLMLQSLAFDRKSFKGPHFLLLLNAMISAHLENHPLHILWFYARWNEMKGQGTWAEIVGPIELQHLPEEKRSVLEPLWKSLSETVAATDEPNSVMIAETVRTIGERIEYAQAHDFDVDATNIGWWQENPLIEGDFSRASFVNPGDIEDILKNVDPVERRRFMACIARLEGVELPDYFRSENPFSGGPAIKIHQEQGEEALIEYFTNINKFLTAYLLFRGFHNDHPAQNLLWYICMLNFLIGLNSKEYCMRLWKECRTAMEAHVPPIWGLWLLDLGRLMLHKGMFGDTFAGEMQWLHAKERKFLKALQDGNYNSES